MSQFFEFTSLAHSPSNVPNPHWVSVDDPSMSVYFLVNYGSSEDVCAECLADLIREMDPFNKIPTGFQSNLRFTSL